MIAVDNLGNSAPVITDHVPVYPTYSRELVAVYLKIATSAWHREWMQQYWWLHDGTLDHDDIRRLEVNAESDKEASAILRLFSDMVENGHVTPELEDMERHMRAWDY